MKKLFNRAWNAFDGLAVDTIWGGVADLMGLVVTLMSFIFLQKVLSLSTYGSYIALYAIVAPFGALVYGPSIAVVKARLRDNEPADKTLRSYLSLSLIVGFFGAFFATVIGLLIADDLSVAEVGFIMASELLFVSVVRMCGRLVQTESGYPPLVRTRIGLQGIKAVIFLALAWCDVRFAEDGVWLLGSDVPFIEKFEALTILNLGIGYTVAYGLYCIWLLKSYLPKHRLNVSFGLPARKTYKESFVFAVPMAAGQVQTNGDKAALRMFDFAADAGLYGAAYRVVMLGLMPLSVLDSAAFQRFLPDDVRKPGVHLKRSIKFASLMFAVSLVLASILFFAQPLLGFLFDEKFSEAQDIVPWLLIFIPLVALSGTPLNGLVGLGRTVQRSYIYLSSAAVSVVFYLIFIPSNGWQGALWATVLSEAYLVVASWVGIVYYQRVADSELRAELEQSAVIDLNEASTDAKELAE